MKPACSGVQGMGCILGTQHILAQLCKLHGSGLSTSVPSLIPSFPTAMGYEAVAGSADGTPLGTAMLTVSPVAQHLTLFISMPNFRPLLCRVVPAHSASCPFLQSPCQPS